jgi:solute carrier family 39 (zinc transporter), member 1/2/3
MTFYTGTVTTWQKIYTTVLLFIATLLFSLLPWAINSKIRKPTTVISLLTCYTGGVVFGTLMFHLIPEMQVSSFIHELHDDLGVVSHDAYPWGLLFAGLSFIFLLGADRLYLSHKDCPNNETAQEPTIPNEHSSCHSADVMGGCHMDGISKRTTKLQAYMFVFVLSIHSFLEGLATESANTYTKMLVFISSLFLHKLLEAFALGVNVFRAGFELKAYLLLVTFYSALTPLGMLLSILVSTKNTVLSEIFNGVAAGSFLYVSCIEMIVPEFHKADKMMVCKYLFLLFGFLLMAGVSLIPHSHLIQ